MALVEIACVCAGVAATSFGKVDYAIVALLFAIYLRLSKFDLSQP